MSTLWRSDTEMTENGRFHGQSPSLRYPYSVYWMWITSKLEGPQCHVIHKSASRACNEGPNGPPALLVILLYNNCWEWHKSGVKFADTQLRSFIFISFTQSSWTSSCEIFLILFFPVHWSLWLSQCPTSDSHFLTGYWNVTEFVVDRLSTYVGAGFVITCPLSSLHVMLLGNTQRHNTALRLSFCPFACTASSSLT